MSWRPASTSVIREEPLLQQMLTKPLCCGGTWLSGPQMIMEMRTGEIRAIAPELWPECPGGYMQVAQTGLQRTLVSQHLVLKSYLASLVFKSGEQEKITQLPCGSVGARRGHAEFGDLWSNILGMYHRLLCFLSASG